MTLNGVSRTPSNDRSQWVVPLLFMVLSYFPYFLHLEVLPLRVWDESRQAISAYEMLHNGDLLVTHFRGEPDMWSTKPPLLIWLQTALFALLGPGELALRLPSALAALAIGWFLLRTIGRVLSGLWMGLIAGVVLCTSPGFVSMHIVRSGDYDALLVLFMTLSAWAMFRWCLHQQARDILLFCLFLTLGVLTKSVQALMFLPGLFLFLLWERKLLPLLRLRQTYLGLFLFILLVGGFYLARESANPGYLEAVWMNELGGRYGGALERHRAPWNFYIEMLIDHHFSAWWWLVPCGIVLGLAHREAGMRRWTVLLTLLSVTYLFVISSAGTKLEWYSAPLYPLFAALVAIAIHVPFTWLFNEQWSTTLLRARVMPYLYLFLVFLVPYSAVVARVYFPKEWPWDNEVYDGAYHLKNALRTQAPLGVDALCYDSDNAFLQFYLDLLQERGERIQSISKHTLHTGQQVMATEGPVKGYIESHYRHEVVEDKGALRIYRINGENNGAP